MSVKFAYFVSMSVAMIIFAGCGGLYGRDDDKAAYRTITAEPLRDTETAKKANALGLKYLAEDRLDLAEKEFTRALAADVDFGPAHNNLGKVYFKNHDMYKAAWEFEYACKLLPKQASPRNNLGIVLEESGELDRAVEYYRQAVALEPDNVEYAGNLARALIRRGDHTDEVRGLLKKVLAKDTRPEWLTWAKRQEAIIGQTPN